MTLSTGLLIVAAILAIAAIPVVHRIIVGPTILDRAVASDMLVVLLVMAMTVYAASARSVHAGAAMLSMTALAFLSTVAIARFVAREDQPAAPAAEAGEEPDVIDARPDIAEERTLGTQAPLGQRPDTDGAGARHGDR
ncbi:monovalent cation/H+ antiporter complex subunit F [Brachybacterium nesterenkovii]|uniref:monovalent cation/H+ antiporter complex subunit F n=1 Tax=Brachybacterium nesterenkovii TaxID=47847 RepID=UPI00321996D9